MKKINFSTLKNDFFLAVKNIDYKHYLIAIAGGIISWAISGSIQGFTTSNVKLTIISISIIVSFSGIILLGLALASKDNYISIINKAIKKGNWLEVYTLCEPLSSALWKMSKLRLRVKIGEKYKDSLDIFKDKTEINDKPFDYNEKMAQTYIDDLGYTKYMIAVDNIDIVTAINNIYLGKQYAKDIRNDDKKLTVQLKACRHLLAIYNDGRYPDDNLLNDEKCKEKVVSDFNSIKKQIEEKIYSSESGNNYLQEQLNCAQYANYKYEYEEWKKSKKGDSMYIITNIESLSKELKKENKTEWVEKCQQLVWEIQCDETTEDKIIINNKVEISKKLEEKDIWPNRKIKILNLYIRYINLMINKGLDDSTIKINEAKSIIKEYKRMVKQCENYIIKCEFKINRNTFYKLSSSIKR